MSSGRLDELLGSWESVQPQPERRAIPSRMADSNASAPEYVLGTGADELERLGFQARLWADAAHALWRRARIGPGQHVLDVGCGPGHASFDLAMLVTRRGRVVGIDESPNFVQHANAQAAARNLPQLTAVRGDGHDIPAALASLSNSPPVRGVQSPAPPFDLAYARWVLCFVRDPAAVVRSVASVLKPGAFFAVHDYFNYETMTCAPRRDIYTRVVAATARSWRDRGGDPDVAGRLPAMLDAAGFDVVHMDVHQRTARPGDTMWHWPDTWWRTYTPKLLQMGYITRQDHDEMLATLDDLCRSKTDFVVCPPVFEILAVKRPG